MREQTGGSHREQSQDADTVRQALEKQRDEVLRIIDGGRGTMPEDRRRVYLDPVEAPLAALARLVAAAERTEAETKRADWLYQDCEEKLAEIKAAEAERDAAKREQFRAEEAARVATALWEGANDACGDLRAERDAALAQVELARRVTDAYTAEAEDHNDGEFALWKADDLINAIVALRAALGGPDA